MTDEELNETLEELRIKGGSNDLPFLRGEE